MDEVTVVEIGYLKQAIEDLKKQNKDLNDKLNEVILFVHEFRALRTWLFGALSVAAIVGGLVTQTLHTIKLF